MPTEQPMEFQPRPLVGVSASRVAENAHPFHRCSEKYLQCVVDPAGCTPIILPALGDPALVDTYVDRMDGILLTGGAANVEPHNYDGTPSVDGTKHDPYRDATMLPLIRRCVERGVPVLGLCLGLQEMNVAFGGSLHQRVFDLTDKFDHRMRRDVDDHDRRYRPAHNIRMVAGGLLWEIIGQEEVLVNSLHAQSINRPGDGVRIEAVAPDGIVEADARTEIEALEQHFDLILRAGELDEDIETVGGLVSRLAGRVPHRHDRFDHPAGLIFEIVDADPRRVKRVRVSVMTPPCNSGEA